jgi:hypothetical protein
MGRICKRGSGLARPSKTLASQDPRTWLNADPDDGG